MSDVVMNRAQRQAKQVFVVFIISSYMMAFSSHTTNIATCATISNILYTVTYSNDCSHIQTLSTSYTDIYMKKPTHTNI